MCKISTTVIWRSLTVVLCLFLVVSMVFSSSASSVYDLIYFRFYFTEQAGASNYTVTQILDGDQIYSSSTNPVYFGVRYFNSDILDPSNYIFTITFHTAAVTQVSEADFYLKVGKFQAVVEQVIFTSDISSLDVDPVLAVDDSGIYTLSYLIPSKYDSVLRENNSLMAYCTGFDGAMFYLLNSYFGLTSEFDTDQYQNDVLQNMNTINNGIADMNQSLDEMNESLDSLLEDELNMIEDGAVSGDASEVVMDVENSGMWDFLDNVISLMTTNETIDYLPVPAIVIPSLSYGNKQTPEVPIIAEDTQISIGSLLNSAPIVLLRSGSYVMYTIFFIGYIIDYQRDLLSRFSLSGSDYTNRSITLLTQNSARRRSKDE